MTTVRIKQISRSTSVREATMPALRYMGRRWGIGADELTLPSLCSMSLRVVWTIALVVILVRVFSK